MASKGGFSANLKGAIVSFVFGTLLVIIAFSSNSWLETDGRLQNPKFIRLGLWNVCLQDFKDIRHLYDRVFNGCRHILDKEYHFIDDFLRPPFFIAVQTFFTFCFVFVLIATFAIAALFFFYYTEYLIFVLQFIGLDLLIAAFCGTISVITFGALGDSRNWMPDFENNYLSWSFGLAVVGTLVLYLSAILFLTEAKVQRKMQGTTQSQATFVTEHRV